MEKLDCKSLMIGDWVCYSKPNNYCTKVNEIKCTHDFPDDMLYYIKGQRDNRDRLKKEFDETFVVDILSPIPLTAEILEKNGFTGGKYKDYCGFVFYLSADGFREIGLTMSYKDNILWCEKIKPNYPNSFGDKYSIHHLDYVHELQHAMRLCGIEKEIIL